MIERHPIGDDPWIGLHVRDLGIAFERGDDHVIGRNEEKIAKMTRNTYDVISAHRRLRRKLARKAKLWPVRMPMAVALIRSPGRACAPRSE